MQLVLPVSEWAPVLLTVCSIINYIPYSDQTTARTRDTYLPFLLHCQFKPWHPFDTFLSLHFVFSNPVSHSVNFSSLNSIISSFFSVPFLCLISSPFLSFSFHFFSKSPPATTSASLISHGNPLGLPQTAGRLDQLPVWLTHSATARILTYWCKVMNIFSCTLTATIMSYHSIFRIRGILQN